MGKAVTAKRVLAARKVVGSPTTEAGQVKGTAETGNGTLGETPKVSVVMTPVISVTGRVCFFGRAGRTVSTTVTTTVIASRDASTTTTTTVGHDAPVSLASRVEGGGRREGRGRKGGGRDAFRGHTRTLEDGNGTVRGPSAREAKREATRGRRPTGETRGATHTNGRSHVTGAAIRVRTREGRASDAPATRADEGRTAPFVAETTPAVGKAAPKAGPTAATVPAETSSAAEQAATDVAVATGIVGVTGVTTSSTGAYAPGVTYSVTCCSDDIFRGRYVLRSESICQEGF